MKSQTIAKYLGSPKPPKACQTKPEQDKATARPWGIFHEHNPRTVTQHYSIVGNLSADERKQSLICNSTDKDDAALIVRAVNEYAALNAVAEAANQMFKHCDTEDVSPMVLQRMADTLTTLAALRKWQP